jgi:hypothetical protein
MIRMFWASRIRIRIRYSEVLIRIRINVEVIVMGTLKDFMYRRPTLYTLQIAVDFLKSL